MKYVITFHNKIKDGVNRDQTLTFGEYDVKGVAKKCFELGATGRFDSVSFKRVNNGEVAYCDDCILLDICGIEGCLDESMTYCDYKHRFIDKKEIKNDT